MAKAEETQAVEWWETIEEALHDAESHVKEYEIVVLLDELGHLYLVREWVDQSIERYKAEIISEVNTAIDDAKTRPPGE